MSCDSCEHLYRGRCHTCVIEELQNSSQAVLAENRQMREELKAAHELAKKTDRVLLHARLTASFFACSIKSGEEWSEEHEAAMKELHK